MAICPQCKQRIFQYTWLCTGIIDNWNQVSCYVKAATALEARQKMRKQKQFKGVKHIKALSCISEK